MRRLSKDAYLMKLAQVAALRSTCDRKYVGCVIASLQGRVLATGYNGSAPGAPHCDDEGHIMHEGHCKRVIHAEMNAVGDAARRGNALEGAVAYVTASPCTICMPILIAAGISEVVYLEEYRDPDIAWQLAHLARVSLVRLPLQDRILLGRDITKRCDMCGEEIRVGGSCPCESSR